MSEIERAIASLNKAKLYCDWHFHSSHWKLGKEFIDAVDTALTALCEKQERERGRGCKWCREAKKHQAHMNGDTLVTDETGSYGISTWEGWDDSSISMRGMCYCPLCGRRLTATLSTSMDESAVEHSTEQSDASD